ncbi:transposase [Streptomyces sp. NPDC006872]|uniref:transposase n=1 Tax=Streptomyces sp. NPDC006872 TaxID=3155720 RepID=UPI0033C35472
MIATVDGRTQVRLPGPRKYPDELRERAVREVQTSGRPVPHVVRDLGIHMEALRQWVRQAKADQGNRPDLLTTTEKDELTQLRKEKSRVEAGERDPESSLGVFREGARPAPHEADAVFSQLRDDSGDASIRYSHPAPRPTAWQKGSSPFPARPRSGTAVAVSVTTSEVGAVLSGRLFCVRAVLFSQRQQSSNPAAGSPRSSQWMPYI